MIGSMTNRPMEALGFLLGHWSGSGWHQQGSSPAQRFEQTEDVRARLGGELITVEGRGVRADGSGEVVHRGFAVASYEPGNGYRWTAFSAGQRIETTLRIGDHTFAWSLHPDPSTSIDYHARIDGDQWHETGQLRTGERPTTTILEMTLRRDPG